MLRSLLALAAIAATLLWGRIALADAAPIQLVLVYLPNVSNTGSSKATGIAELVMTEGEVRIKVAGLSRLDGDQQYVAWLLNSHSNAYQRLGAGFNTAASTGAADHETVLPDAIPDDAWNLLLLTIEDSADADAPSTRHSIAGVFPSPDNAPLPVALPNTGGDPDVDVTSACSGGAVECVLARLGDHLSVVSRAEWVALTVPAGLGAALLFGAGYGLGLRRR
jgi:hypothetical protein